MIRRIQWMRASMPLDSEAIPGSTAPCGFNLSPLFLLVLLLLAGLLTACSGGLGATDGGVPLGKPGGTFTGQVVLASNPGQAVSGAILTLAITSGSPYGSTTDASGSYTFVDVPQGPTVVSITPPSGQNLAPLALPLSISTDSTRILVAALAPQSEYNAATGITLSAPSINLKVGASTIIHPVVAGVGIPAGTLPSLVISGGVAQVFADGTVLATHPGTGALTATFGAVSTTIPIVVTAPQ